MSALANIDQNAFRQRVEDHITNTFGTLIPNDQFAALVDAQVKSFFETKETIRVREYETTKPGGHWNDKITLQSLTWDFTPFQQLVHATLNELVKKRLAEHMADTNESNPINVFIASMLKSAVFEGHQLKTVQEMMLALAAKQFEFVFNAAHRDSKAEIGMAFARAGYSDLSNALQRN
jgi:hypothetical protein